MRRLLGFLVFLAIVLVAVCLWQGWFTIFVDKQKYQARHEGNQARGRSRRRRRSRKRSIPARRRSNTRPTIERGQPVC